MKNFGLSDGFEIFFEDPSGFEIDGRDRFLALRMFLGLEFEMLAIDCDTNEDSVLVVIDEVTVDDVVLESLSPILPVFTSCKGSTAFVCALKFSNSLATYNLFPSQQVDF